MKKSALSILSLIFLSGAIVGLVGCNKNHTHSFTEQKVEQQYLASEATCTEAAKYYYSCACGEKGSSTFESGNALGHDFGEWVTVKESTEKEKGLKTRTCVRTGCGYSENAEIPEFAHTHSFTEQKVEQQYLASEATCTEAAKYYYSCACGEKGSSSFENGNALGHDFGEWTIVDSKKTRKCMRNGCEYSETEEIAEPTDSKWFKFTLLYDGSGYSVSKCDGYDVNTYPTEIVIPKTYNGELVTSIGNYAFVGCDSLTSVTIPDSVTSIGEWAFYSCSGLTSVTIPDSVVYIGNDAFRGCSGLESISVSKGNTRYHSNGNCLIETETKTLILGCKNSIIPSDGSVTSIGDSAFESCSELTSVTIPDSVTSIGNDAFNGCSNLTSVTIPDSVTYIGDVAFGGCSGLTSVTIGNSVTGIGDLAFGGCSGLTSVTIPDSVTSIGKYAFRGCSGLESISVSSGNAKYHSNGNCLIETETKTLISGCKNSIIPSDGSVTSIGVGAFDGCSELTSVTIPDGVTSIGDFAFRDCIGLTSVTIPDSVTSIGEYAFV